VFSQFELKLLSITKENKEKKKTIQKSSCPSLFLEMACLFPKNDTFCWETKCNEIFPFEK
jgi:hypothetical protein